MKSKAKILSSFVVLFLLIPLSVLAWSGKCVGVSDVDTISVMHEGKDEKITLLSHRVSQSRIYSAIVAATITWPHLRTFGRLAGLNAAIERA
jgi:small-conductance mechanosensitive channel